jgi:hypothetical protein
MNNNDFLNLIYPPQWVAKILHLCISGAQSKNQDGLKSELLYLVLPLLTIDLVKNRLNHANASTSFDTIFEECIVPNKECLMGFSKRIESFVEITNDGLFFLNNEVDVHFSDFVTVSKQFKYKKSNLVDEDYYRAAHYLGLIFSKNSSKYVFMKLGVVPL